MSSQEAFKREITDEIKRFVREDPGNSLELDGQPIYGEPLVGFASGQDPIFQKLKAVIGEFHLTPREAFEKAAELKGAEAPSESSLGIVSFVLPMHPRTVEENARETDKPSRRWVHTHFYGWKFRGRLVEHLISWLGERGVAAVAPEHSSFFATTVDPKVGYASNWSERHVAYAAGLGTFGLSDGLITDAGVAEVVGSVIVDVPFASPERPDDIHAACLYYQKGTCRACVKRCPAGAITEKGHDKAKCRKFAFGQTPLNKERYGLEVYSCGLCMMGVPCATRDPMKREVQVSRPFRRPPCSSA